MDYSEKLKNQILDISKEKRMQWKKSRQPISVHFEITPNCNFQCVHCYMKKIHKEHSLSTEEIKRIIDRLYDIGVLFITFTGGEIFTRKDFPEIYLYAKHKGFIIELFTNGYSVSNEILEIFKIFPPLLVDISLYGSCEETYYSVTGVKNAFNIVINNCKKLINSNVRVALKSPILTLTYDEINKMKDLAKSLGVIFRCSFELISTLDNDDETLKYQLPMETILQYEFNEFDKQKNESIKDDLKRYNLFYCKIGINSFVIDYKGNICPCMKYRSIGENFLKCDFNKLWSQYDKFTAMKIPSNHRCYECHDYYYCENCPAEMESVYGSLFSCDENKCKMAKLRAQFYRNSK